MFTLDQPHGSWRHTPSGKSQRQLWVKEGVWVIEHVATGKLMFGHDTNVSRAIDRIIARLKVGRYEHSALQKLYESDMELKFYEIPVKGPRKCKKLDVTLRKSTYPQYLILN